MPPCWIFQLVYQLFLFIVVKGEMNDDYFGNLGFGSDRSENDFQIDFNPSAVLAFVPVRSCHLHLSGDHGTFSPPVIYGNIQVNLWCNWTVLAAPGKHIVIYITGFRTNESCSDNLDEIIFEGVSSSVESSIVYACWNKLTHVFATEASAVNVVLLWRSFSSIGSKRYFNGKYYIFDDPVHGPSADSANCSLANKQNISTSDVIQPSLPDETLKAESYLYSVFPKSSSSKSIKSHIHHSPEVYHPQGPPTVMETYMPSLTIDYLPTVTTHDDNMLVVTQTVAHSPTTIDNIFKSQLPVLTQSLELEVYKSPTFLPTADLEPSRVVKWEANRESAHSEFLSETPSLISAYSTLLEAAYLGVTSRIVETPELSKDQPSVESVYVSTINIGEHPDTAQPFPYSNPTTLRETSQFGTAHTLTFQETSYFDKLNVSKSHHLSEIDFIEPPGEPYFSTVLATNFPQPSLIHILNTDVPDHLFISNLSYPSNIQTTETSPLSTDQITKQVNLADLEFSKILNISVANSIEFPEATSLNLTGYIEPTVSIVGIVHHIDSMETKPLYVTDIIELSEVPKLTDDNKVDLLEMQHFSTVHTIGPSVFLNTAESTYLQIPLTINVDSHPVEPVSEYPWQVASSLTTSYPDSFNKSHSQSTLFTETHTSELHGHIFPLQVSEQPSPPSYESALHPPFTPTKSLNVILAKTDMADPDAVESYTKYQVAPSSTTLPISSPQIRTSDLGLQMVHPTLWVTVEQLLDPSSPQSTSVVNPDQQLMLGNTVPSHPTSEIAIELIYSKSTPENTENIDKMAPVNEDISSEHLESLPTIDNKITRPLVETMKELDWWTVIDNLEATDSIYTILEHPISTSMSHVILGKSDVADLDGVESYTKSQVAPSSAALPISSLEIRTSDLGFQMVQPTHWTTVEQLLDPLSKQSTVVNPDQQLMLGSLEASQPTPEIPTNLISSNSTLQITVKIDKMSPVNEHIPNENLESHSSPAVDYKVTSSLVEPAKELDWWTIKDSLEATDSISTISERRTDNSESHMDITTIELISEGNEKSTYSYQTNSDLSLDQNAAGQPRGGFLDEQDVTYFGNELDLTFTHKPGDSLFVITTEMENRDMDLAMFQEDLVKSVRDKITERMVYFPGGRNSLILKQIRWTDVNTIKLTFWLQLNQGGKEMINFLKTQLKALENDPFGSSGSTLVSFTVEDVNECQLGIQKCHTNAYCVNMIGSYSCICMDGYEDHSVTASGTVCVSTKFAEIHSLSEHLDILIGAIVAVAVVLLLIIIILCMVKQKRRAKVNFSLQSHPTLEHGGHLGGDLPGQPLSSPTRHGREHHTARDTSSTLELTRITIEQASC